MKLYTTTNPPDEPDVMTSIDEATDAEVLRRAAEIANANSVYFTGRERSIAEVLLWLAVRLEGSHREGDQKASSVAALEENPQT